MKKNNKNRKSTDQLQSPKNDLKKIKRISGKTAPELKISAISETNNHTNNNHINISSNGSNHLSNNHLSNNHYHLNNNNHENVSPQNEKKNHAKKSPDIEKLITTKESQKIKKNKREKKRSSEESKRKPFQKSNSEKKVVTKKPVDEMPASSKTPEPIKRSSLKKSEKSKKVESDHQKPDLLHKNLSEKGRKPPKIRKTLERNHNSPGQKETKSTNTNTNTTTTNTETNPTKSGEIELPHRSGIFSKSNSKPSKITRKTKNVGKDDTPIKKSPKTPPRIKKTTRKSSQDNLDFMDDDRGLSSTYTKPKKPFFRDEDTKPPKADLANGDPSSQPKIINGSANLFVQSTADLKNIITQPLEPKDSSLKDKSEKLSPIKNEELKKNNEILSPAIYSIPENSETKKKNHSPNNPDINEKPEHLSPITNIHGPEKTNGSDINLIGYIPKSFTPLDNLKRYIASPVALHKQYLLQEIPVYVETMDYEEAIDLLPPYIEELTKDISENIRERTAKLICSLLVSFIKYEDFKEKTLSHFCLVYIPILFKLVKDPISMVREASVDSIISICCVLTSEDISEYIIYPLENLLKKSDNKNEGYYLIVLKLIHGIYQKSNQTSRTILVGILETLKMSDMISVRKYIGSTLGSLISRGMNDSTTPKLLRIFCELSQDKNPEVRKSCLESICGISKNSSQEERLTQILPILGNFVKDESQIVRESTCEILGHFITTFNSPPPPVLLDYYQLWFKETMPDSTQNPYMRYCAFNFPAVLQTYGVEIWDQLEPLYHTLLHDPQIPVRKSLSQSLYILADVLKNEQKIRYSLDIFLKDPSDEVRLGVYKILDKLFIYFQLNIQEEYLLSLEKTIMDEKNWRIRRSVAKKILLFSSAFSWQQLDRFILPLMIKLYNDTVPAVRKSLNITLCHLLQKMSLDQRPSNWEQFLLQLINRAQQAPYKERVAYIQLCHTALDILDKKIFEEIFLKELIYLAKDKVPNVRIAFATALPKLIEKGFKESVNGILYDLQNDIDPDVSLITKGIT